ncbi:MAG: response regulator transcription factor [Candidatus Kaiserbacteria bacterium]|nr:response regulator transcription factor [Candidatus Kaiserbacteria bacterium]MCB9816795.1 response regulator transcription factor [Candidatus Nomurabacteria bacterium]
MEPRQVLIIEDDEALQALYAKIIGDADITVRTASTGTEGVSLALEHHPDVILVDVMLPDISGHDAVKKIRLDSWGKNATIIFLTNRTDAESVVNAVEEGSDEYIVKAHISNKELLNRVRAAMMA